MFERGRTIEFPKKFYRRIKIAANIEGKSIAQFATETLEQKISQIERDYAAMIMEQNKEDN